ncbi:MAG TPA: hypothetical protein VFM64_04765 [Candidatus Nitrosotenuis sp.]|nr:hypothetical protein [Candidatus Nitrosotenuis sp.]
MNLNSSEDPFSLLSVDVVCGKCGSRISNMKMLKSIKDVMKHYNNKCPSCGQSLSTSEFSVEVDKN